VSIEEPILERVIKRDRFIVVAGLAAVSVASWLYILAGAGMDMGDMTLGPASSAGAMTDMAPPWPPSYFFLMLVMWWVMMVAMMLPSAAPTVLLFATINRKSRTQGRPHVSTSVFGAGYLLAWGGFSVAATTLQWELENMALLSPVMMTGSAFLGGALLIGAGIYQLTPLKHACLRHCRSPFDFVTHHWRRGTLGAFRMGLEHGLFCLGCCWVLMVLLFYGGVMNLWWIAGLALYILIEKIIPAGLWVGRFAGLVLIVWGGWVLLEASRGA
jgi:predicted metal-binding membrane protein